MTREFVPTAVFVPAEALWDNHGRKSADPDLCQKLHLDGDNSYARLYTKDAWEQDGKPTFVRRADEAFALTEEGDEVRLGPEVGEIHLLPQIAVVKVNETENWSEDVRARAPRIYGVYLVDTTQVTHLCSFEANYAAEFIESQYDIALEIGDNESDSDRLNMDIMDGDATTEPGTYFSRSSVDTWIKNPIQPGCLPDGFAGGYSFSLVKDLDSVLSEDAIEEAMEWGRANQL